jgi:uncharacterized protein (TIGR03435 family)
MTFAKLTIRSHRTVLLTAALAVIAAASALAQQSEKTPPIAFQTASVRFTKPESRERCAPNASVGQTFTVRNCALGALILFAYDALQEQVSGQTSLLNETYDITASAEHPVSRNEMKRMLQTLLEDRFKLTLHRETKEIPVYAIVVGKDGPKFHQSEISEEGPRPVQGSTGQLIFKNMAMSDLVFALSRRIKDRTIVDKTGLIGKYDLDMTWYLELGKPDPPSVFTAVQVLGLKLEPQKSPVEFIVIEHVQQPSEN